MSITIDWEMQMKQNDFYEVDGCTDFIPVKFIEEHKHMTNPLKVELTETGYRAFVPRIYSFPKVNEPKKPVVPKFVLDWVDNSMEYRFDFDEWFDCNNQPKMVQLWLNPENKRQAELNALALVTLIVKGANAVEVEQEKLYTVEIPNPNLKVHTILQKVGKGLVLIPVTNARWRGWAESKLTEAEIKKDFDFLWQWAKEVE